VVVSSCGIKKMRYEMNAENEKRIFDRKRERYICLPAYLPILLTCTSLPRSQSLEFRICQGRLCLWTVCKRTPKCIRRCKRITNEESLKPTNEFANIIGGPWSLARFECVCLTNGTRMASKSKRRNKTGERVYPDVMLLNNCCVPPKCGRMT
jgi:hypothetical protein